MMHKTRHYFCPKIFILTYLMTMIFGLVFFAGISLAEDAAHGEGYMQAYSDIIATVERIER